MYNPPHPGEVLREWIPPDMTVTEAANALQINRVTLSNLLNGKAGVTANIAFDANGDLIKPPYTLFEVQQGQWKSLRTVGGNGV